MRDEELQKVAVMVEGGKKLGKILQRLLDEAQIGVALLTLEDQAQKYIHEAGGIPSFQTVKGYRFATCLCVNDEVVHGLPRPYILKEGDVLTIDIGMLYRGFHTDTAWTKIMDNGKLKMENEEEYAKKKKFLQVGEETLWEAIKVARPGNRVGDISACIQKNIEESGYSVVKTLTGHAVGLHLHEEPMIPGYVSEPVDKTPLLTAGMTLAIEVIYATGKGSIAYANDDGWTLASRDRSLTAVFEHSIAATEEKTLVLTKA